MYLYLYVYICIYIYIKKGGTIQIIEYKAQETKSQKSVKI